MPITPDHVDAPVALEAAVLTHLLGRCRGRSPRPTHSVCRALAHYGRTAPIVDGVVTRPRFPDLPRGPWPSGEKGLRAHGVDFRQLQRSYRELKHSYGPCFSFDERLLLDLVPPELWPVIRCLAEDGPSGFAVHAERVIAGFALSRVEGNKVRDAGAPTMNSVRGVRGGLVAVAEVLVALRELGAPYAVLSDWRMVPKVTVRDIVTEPKRDVRAPRFEVARTAWHAANDDLRRVLSADERDDLRVAVGALGTRAILAGGIFTRFRTLLALTFLVLLGGRIDAIRQLNRSDFVEHRVGPPPDHRAGPVLVLRPEKTLSENVERAKPIPEELAVLIEAWLLFLKLQRAAAYRSLPSLDRARPETEELPADFPLLPGNRVRLSRWDRSSIQTLFSGRPPRLRGDKLLSGSVALVQRDGGWASGLPIEHRKYAGHTTREFRRLAEQLAEEAGARWNAAHPSSNGRGHPEPTLYGSALLDHKPQGDPIRALYSERDSDATYELLSGRAIAGIWEKLSDPIGVRRKPDRAAMERHAKHLWLVEAELGRLHRRAERLGAEESPAPARLVFEPAAPARDERALLSQLVRGQQQFADRQDLLLARIECLRRENAAYGRLLYEQLALTDLRDELRSAIWRLWSDESTWEVVPDSAPPGAELIDFTLEDVLGGRHAVEADPDDTPALVRVWVLPVELAWIAEVDRGTITRQLVGDHLPVRVQDRPWEADAVPVDLSQGLRHRRIWVPGIKATYWKTATMRRRLYAVLAGWPDLQLWTSSGEPTPRSLAPLVLPEPFASMYAAEQDPLALPPVVAAPDDASSGEGGAT